MKTLNLRPNETLFCKATSLAILLALGSIHATAQTGPVAHWKFDEAAGTTSADATANKNNGSLTNGPTWVTGFVGNALSFDGVNDYVEVANNASLGITDEITIAAWIKRGAVGDYGGILAKTDGANVWDYDLYFGSGGNSLHFWSDRQSPQDAVSTGTVSDLEWHHVAVTHKGGLVTFYIDGVAAGTVEVSGSFEDNPHPVRIGTDGPAYSADSMFKGLIDDVRLYNRALSAEEILNLYPNLSFTIVEQPEDLTEAAGFTASFSVRASQPLGLIYQWYKGANPIAGAKAATYTTLPLTLSDNGSQFRVTAGKAGGIIVTSRVATLTVVAPVFSPGFLKREIFRNIPGEQISNLTSDPKYPNAPDAAELIAGFETPTDVENNYGQRVSGFITPSQTGHYIFFMASDDNGELLLSTDDTPANKRQIAIEPSWNPTRNWIGTTRRDSNAPENRSASIRLEAGRRYYVEALQKEGGGGDNLGVTAIKEGDPLPENGSAPLQGNFIGTFAAPSKTSVTFTNQPQNVVSIVAKTATFTAGASSSSSPIVYQWQKNGAAIFKANSASYTTAPLTAPDQGAQFQCVAYIRGGASATSLVATVTVSSDVTPPSLRVAALADPTTGKTTQVSILFDEAVEQASAQQALNYRINDGAIAVSSAVLQPDLKRVVLTTAPLSAGVDYKLSVKNVADRSATRNAITEIIRAFQATHLVAHFTFDDPTQPAANTTANANDGTLVDQPALVSGFIGGALSFDGVNDYVNVPNSPSLGITDDITLSAWIKRSALGDYGGLIAKTDGVNIWDYDLYFGSGANTLHFWSDAQSPQDTISTGIVADTNWHHVAATRMGVTVTFYIDGVPAGTVEVSGSSNDNPLPVRIGTDGPSYSAASLFNGLMDDVRIYNRALSVEEIRQLMPPRLSITFSAGKVLLSWPAAALGFILESTSSLSAPSWTTVSDPASIGANQKTVSLSISGNARFFRLRSP